MSNDFRIRQASPTDRAAIGRLWQELMDFHSGLDPDAFLLAPGALDAQLRFLDERMADEDSMVLVADTGQTLVGFIVGRLEEGPPVYQHRQHGAIWDTCVTQSWRRRGVGRKLVADLLDWFRQRGLRDVDVGAAACNPLSNAFWHALGFRPHMIRMRRAVDVGTTDASNSG